MDFDCVPSLDGLPPELPLVSLPGHTHGHVGVAMHQSTGWHLPAGDAYFHADEMDVDAPRCRRACARTSG